MVNKNVLSVTCSDWRRVLLMYGSPPIVYCVAARVPLASVAARLSSGPAAAQLSLGPGSIPSRIACFQKSFPTPYAITPNPAAECRLSYKTNLQKPY